MVVESLTLCHGFGQLPREDGIDFIPDRAPLDTLIKQVVESQIGREQDIYRTSLDIWPASLWKIPSRFIGAF